MQCLPCLPKGAYHKNKHTNTVLFFMCDLFRRMNNGWKIIPIEIFFNYASVRHSTSDSTCLEVCKTCVVDPVKISDKLLGMET